jgi:hypothetical protein
MKSDGSQASESDIKKEDQNMALLNSLLSHLGGEPIRTYAVNEQAGKDDKDEGDGEETEGDRDTKMYMQRLEAEGGAQQAVLQLLARALGEVCYVFFACLRVFVCIRKRGVAHVCLCVCASEGCRVCTCCFCWSLGLCCTVMHTRCGFLASMAPMYVCMYVCVYICICT